MKKEMKNLKDETVKTLVEYYRERSAIVEYYSILNDVCEDMHMLA